MKELKFPYSEVTIPLNESTHKFLQTDELTVEGVAVHPYGAIINPKGNEDGVVKVCKNGNVYVVPVEILEQTETGETINLQNEQTNNLVGYALVGYATAG